MNMDISFPDKPILLIEFLNKNEFYYEGEYYIVGKDDVGNLIGIDKKHTVFYLDTEFDFPMYVAPNIQIFVAELKLYDKYSSENELPENPSDDELKEYTAKFTEQMKTLDCNAFKDDMSFWSVIAEQMETEQL